MNKMTNWKIPLFKMYHDKEDVNAVTSVIKRGMFWGPSSETLEFEKRLSKKIQAKYCVVFNSGTSALHALLLAHNIGNSDEVIVPSFTFISSVNSVLFVNAKPKFVDIENETLGLDPQEVISKITKKTKAIIPVHYAGNICKIDEIKKIAREKNIIVIEDAAEALGSTYKGKYAGTFGNSGILSFAFNKLITTGEGGAAITNSKEIYQMLTLLRSHGRIDKESYFLSAKLPKYVSIGYNWRIPAMNAALGISQLKKLDEIIKMRIKNAEYLSEKLSKFSFIETPISRKNVRHTYMMYTVRVKKGKKVRDALQRFLTKNGIQSKINFEPIHLTKFYKEKFGFKRGFLRNTEKISGQILTLPMYPHLSKKEMDYMVNTIQKFGKKV